MQFDPGYSLQEQSHRLPYNPKWEFPRDRLILLETIGAGAFGEVWLAKAQGILEFKAEATSMSPTKQKRFSRIFSSFSNYNNIDMMKNTGLTKVAVKTVKGKEWSALTLVLKKNADLVGSNDVKLTLINR